MTETGIPSGLKVKQIQKIVVFRGGMSRTPLEAGAIGAHVSAFGAKSLLSFLQKRLESLCQAF